MLHGKIGDNHDKTDQTNQSVVRYPDVLNVYFLSGVFQGFRFFDIKKKTTDLKSEISYETQLLIFLNFFWKTVFICKVKFVYHQDSTNLFTIPSHRWHGQYYNNCTFKILQ